MVHTYGGRSVHGAHKSELTPFSERILRRLSNSWRMESVSAKVNGTHAHVKLHGLDPEPRDAQSDGEVTRYVLGDVLVCTRSLIESGVQNRPTVVRTFVVVVAVKVARNFSHRFVSDGAQSTS